MARKAASDSNSPRGFADIIGVVLIAAALLLLVAQLSFDRNDLEINRDPPNKPAHNWIGPLGARTAYASFFVFGFSAYMLPVLLVLFGLAYFFDSFSYLKRRWPWAVVLIVSCMGWLHLMDLPHVSRDASVLARVRTSISAPCVGGFIGMTLYDYLFWMLGSVGAAIVYGASDVISLLFLTNFQLGSWVRGVWARRFQFKPAEVVTPQEQALERRARELKKEAKKLQEQVDRSTPTPPDRSGLGADMQPVPEPTVRDLSVPQSKGGRVKKPVTFEPVKEPQPADECEVISAREIAAATTSEVLGKADSNGKPGDTRAETAAAEGNKPAIAVADAEPKAESEITISGLPSPPPRTKPPAKRPKPITVASTPIIGNYQLPSMDFLQHPDPLLKPTESKEELMANARLMQQTLAQFDIEVSLGDITKGPTITRYELHPAPGVKLEKITALSNNIAAALKAERIHILAPVPGKSSVGVEVPNLVKTKVIMRDLLESDEWRNTKLRIPLALGKDVYGLPIIADLAEMPHLLIAGSTGSGKSVCINAIIASLLYRFSPDQLRFVMIDPKVVELQHYNALPHLVVPVVTDPKKVILALRWVVNEMEKRYQIFAKVGVSRLAVGR
jgi:DNA segregation ATPase FtsK/SpoIIIE, S-DNA-T family